jgi:hypothetical protein
MKELLIGSIIRHVLGGVGSVFIAKGYSDASAWEAITGGALALVALVTSYLNKKRLKK